MVTDSDPLEAEVKAAMIAQAGEPTLLIGADKLRTLGLSVIAPLSQVATTLAAGVSAQEAATLRLTGTTVVAV